MSTQYETQGYTINNAGRRLVVDPITRIEGHMRCEVNINDQNVITNAVSCGTMEIIFFGQILSQRPQPRQRLVSTWAMPSFMQMAFEGQAAAQSPRPRQPYLQASGPP